MESVLALERKAGFALLDPETLLALTFGVDPFRLLGHSQPIPVHAA